MGYTKVGLTQSFQCIPCHIVLIIESYECNYLLKTKNKNLNVKRKKRIVNFASIKKKNFKKTKENFKKGWRPLVHWKQLKLRNR